MHPKQAPITPPDLLALKSVEKATLGEAVKRGGKVGFRFGDVVCSVAALPLKPFDVAWNMAHRKKPGHYPSELIYNKPLRRITGLPVAVASATAYGVIHAGKSLQRKVSGSKKPVSPPPKRIKLVYRSLLKAFGPHEPVARADWEQKINAVFRPLNKAAGIDSVLNCHKVASTFIACCINNNLPTNGAKLRARAQRHIPLPYFDAAQAQLTQERLVRQIEAQGGQYQEYELGNYDLEFLRIYIAQEVKAGKIRPYSPVIINGGLRKIHNCPHSFNGIVLPTQTKVGDMVMQDIYLDDYHLGVPGEWLTEELFDEYYFARSIDAFSSEKTCRNVERFMAELGYRPRIGPELAIAPAHAEAENLDQLEVQQALARKLSM